MGKKNIAQKRFIDVNGDSWYSTDLFYDLDFNDFLNDERFDDLEIIVKLKEPTEKEILSQSQLSDKESF